MDNSPASVLSTMARLNSSAVDRRACVILGVVNMCGLIFFDDLNSASQASVRLISFSGKYFTRNHMQGDQTKQEQQTHLLL